MKKFRAEKLKSTMRAVVSTGTQWQPPHNDDELQKHDRAYYNGRKVALMEEIHLRSSGRTLQGQLDILSKLVREHDVSVSSLQDRSATRGDIEAMGRQKADLSLVESMNDRVNQRLRQQMKEKMDLAEAEKRFRGKVSWPQLREAVGKFVKPVAFEIVDLRLGEAVEETKQGLLRLVQQMFDVDPSQKADMQNVARLQGEVEEARKQFDEQALQHKTDIERLESSVAEALAEVRSTAEAKLAEQIDLITTACDEKMDEVTTEMNHLAKTTEKKVVSALSKLREDNAKQVDAAIGSMRETVDSFVSECQQAREKYEQMLDIKYEREIQSLSKKVQRCEEICQESNVFLSSVRSRLKELAGSQAAVTRNIEKMQKEVRDKVNDMDVLSSTAKELKASDISLTRDLDKLKDNVEDVKKFFAKVQERVKTVEMRAIQSEREFKSKVDDMKYSQQGSASKAQGRLRTLEDRIKLHGRKTTLQLQDLEKVVFDQLKLRAQSDAKELKDLGIAINSKFTSVHNRIKKGEHEVFLAKQFSTSTAKKIAALDVRIVDAEKSVDDVKKKVVRMNTVNTFKTAALLTRTKASEARNKSMMGSPSKGLKSATAALRRSRNHLNDRPEGADAEAINEWNAESPDAKNRDEELQASIEAPSAEDATSVLNAISSGAGEEASEAMDRHAQTTRQNVARDLSLRKESLRRDEAHSNVSGKHRSSTPSAGYMPLGLGLHAEMRLDGVESSVETLQQAILDIEARIMMEKQQEKSALEQESKEKMRSLHASHALEMENQRALFDEAHRHMQAEHEENMQNLREQNEALQVQVAENRAAASIMQASIERQAEIADKNASVENEMALKELEKLRESHAHEVDVIRKGASDMQQEMEAQLSAAHRQLLKDRKEIQMLQTSMLAVQEEMKSILANARNFNNSKHFRSPSRPQTEHGVPRGTSLAREDAQDEEQNANFSVEESQASTLLAQMEEQRAFMENISMKIEEIDRIPEMANRMIQLSNRDLDRKTRDIIATLEKTSHNALANMSREKEELLSQFEASMATLSEHLNNGISSAKLAKSAASPTSSSSRSIASAQRHVDSSPAVVDDEILLAHRAKNVEMEEKHLFEIRQMEKIVLAHKHKSIRDVTEVTAAFEDQLRRKEMENARMRKEYEDQLQRLRNDLRVAVDDQVLAEKSIRRLSAQSSAMRITESTLQRDRISRGSSVAGKIGIAGKSRLRTPAMTPIRRRRMNDAEGSTGIDVRDVGASNLREVGNGSESGMTPEHNLLLEKGERQGAYEKHSQGSAHRSLLSTAEPEEKATPNSAALIKAQEDMEDLRLELSQMQRLIGAVNNKYSAEISEIKAGLKGTERNEIELRTLKQELEGMRSGMSRVLAKEHINEDLAAENATLLSELRRQNHHLPTSSTRTNSKDGNLSIQRSLPIVMGKEKSPLRKKARVRSLLGASASLPSVGHLKFYNSIG
eukprot:g5055.t1